MLYQLSYEATQLGAGQFVGPMISQERTPLSIANTSKIYIPFNVHTLFEIIVPEKEITTW